MHILWQYIRPLRWWVALSLLLAGLAQALTLIDERDLRHFGAANENPLGELETDSLSI